MPPSFPLVPLRPPSRCTGVRDPEGTPYYAVEYLIGSKRSNGAYGEFAFVGNMDASSRFNANIRAKVLHRSFGVWRQASCTRAAKGLQRSSRLLPESGLKVLICTICDAMPDLRQIATHLHCKS